MAQSQPNAVGSILTIGFLLLFGGCAVHACASDHTTNGSSQSPTSHASASPTPTTYSAEEIEASVIDTCQGAVKNDLRDPDSAKFGDDWKAWLITSSGSKPPEGMAFSPSAGDKYYNAGGQVNAKNGFGGYAGEEPYYCDVVVTESGKIHARARSMASLLDTPTDAPTP